MREALARQQQPLLERLAARQREAGQELAAIQRRRLFEISAVRAGGQAREVGRIQLVIAGHVPLE